MPNLHVVNPPPRTPLQDLVSDYLASCVARNLSPATINGNYAFALRQLLLPWCVSEGVERLEDLNQRTLDRYSAHLQEHGGRRGNSSRSTRFGATSGRFGSCSAGQSGRENRCRLSHKCPALGRSFATS